MADKPIMIPELLHGRVKRASALLGITIRELTAQAFDKYLAEVEPAIEAEIVHNASEREREAERARLAVEAGEKEAERLKYERMETTKMGRWECYSPHNPDWPKLRDAKRAERGLKPWDERDEK